LIVVGEFGLTVMSPTVISSATPEGEHNICPVCGHSSIIEPSEFPVRDATCPDCGTLLSFEFVSRDAKPLIHPLPRPSVVTNPESDAQTIIDWWAQKAQPNTHAANQLVGTEPKLQLHQVTDPAQLIALEKLMPD
jgi:hypothetical protein